MCLIMHAHNVSVFFLLLGYVFLTCVCVFLKSDEYLKHIGEAASFIQSKLGTAKIALVLGSGLGPFVEKVRSLFV